MSAYTDKLLSELPGTNPAFFYMLGETSGTTFATTGINDSGLHLTKVGTPSMGTPSIVPGDPFSFSLTNTANTQMAERADNALLDRPNSPGTGFTIAVWAQPALLEPTGTQVLLSKANVFQLMFENSAIRFDVAGVATFKTGADLVTPGFPMFVVAVYNSATNTKKIYLNGIERASAAATGAPTWANATKLEIGGFSSFGTTGFAGTMQHLLIAYDTYLSLSQIQSIYAEGAKTVAESVGKAANVYPWSRQILASNTSRGRLRLTNGSDGTVFLSWESPKGGSGVYTGAVYAISRPLGGAKAVAIYQE
jgi:hypothetical protein